MNPCLCNRSTILGQLNYYKLVKVSVTRVVHEVYYECVYFYSGA
jgi:hypothetical protein